MDGKTEGAVEVEVEWRAEEGGGGSWAPAAELWPEEDEAWRWEKGWTPSASLASSIFLGPRGSAEALSRESLDADATQFAWETVGPAEEGELGRLLSRVPKPLAKTLQESRAAGRRLADALQDLRLDEKDTELVRVVSELSVRVSAHARTLYNLRARLPSDTQPLPNLPNPRNASDAPSLSEASEHTPFPFNPFNSS